MCKQFVSTFCLWGEVHGNCVNIKLLRALLKRASIAIVTTGKQKSERWHDGTRDGGGSRVRVEGSAEEGN